MPIYNFGHGERQNTPNEKQLTQEGETNKTQINWELIERKTRFQTRTGKKKLGFSPVKTDRNPLKNL